MQSVHVVQNTDITDRFDFTFLFGDLNFRLDLSRLHADWLISRRGMVILCSSYLPHTQWLVLEYEQALAFDQLYNIMRNGQAFVGFREATIGFPPTFKYDVLRTTRHKRKRSRIAQAAAEVVAPLFQETVVAGEQPDTEGRHDDGRSEVSSGDETNGELASVISSGTTTFSQRDPVSDEDNDSGAESDYLRRRMAYPQRTGGLVKRISQSAAQRAKSKLAELIHTQSSPHLIRSRRANVPTPQFKSNSKSPRSVPTTPLLIQRAASLTDNPLDDVLASTTSLRSRVQRTPSITGYGTAGSEDDKGVYDSSSKQRVPSWCDRILFKSTVEPDPEPEDDSGAAPQRTAVSLIAQAWRSFRRTSSTSLRSIATTATAPSTSITSNSHPTPPSVDSEPDAARFPPTPYVPRRKRPRPRSIDVGTLTTSQSAFPPTPLPGTSQSAQTHRFPGAKGSSSPNTPVRMSTAPAAPVVGPAQYYREPSPMRTPASSLASSATGSSSATSSGGGSSGGAAIGAAAAPSGGGVRGHPRWRLLSFRSRDPEVARDAADAAAATDADADSESATRAAANATPPSPSQGDRGLDGAAPAAPAAAESPRPRKGDVVCLSYRTLDDREMRRLEGRSDHRPVIGVYAIYV